MANYLLQKYQEVVKALVPYSDTEAHGQMALITINPTLPCFLCGQPATIALIAPAPDYASGGGIPWLTFPLCSACEERQVQSQAGEAE
jgi:hypothetical protein